jgi:hypothetical protein
VLVDRTADSSVLRKSPAEVSRWSQFNPGAEVFSIIDIAGEEINNVLRIYLCYQTIPISWEKIRLEIC